ncbi:hypothetical protein GCM10010385_24840 [Streptomyces geysiriensis]|nr:hypothetical protein GCM10010385_24840 [Streptomyces geysiriensis]
MPEPADCAAKAVPEAPATNARAASIAVLLRVMSAGSFFRGVRVLWSGVRVLFVRDRAHGRGPFPDGMGVPSRTEIRNGPRARWNRPGGVRAGTPAEDASDGPRTRLKVLNAEGGAGGGA